jgi:fumarate reductase iron-sulfur subunit
MSERQIQLEVLRYNPETDSEPHFQTYSVPCMNEWVVLDALNYVKDNLDPTVSYRWSCHMAVCGSCGMMINGEPKLSCKAFIREYSDNIRVEPLMHFPIERDLVTVIDDFIDKLTRVKPFLIPKEQKPLSAGEYNQTPAELKTYKQYTLCINCMLCYAACPEYGLVPEFVGPAAIALAHRYNQDSRDGGREERQQVIASHEGVWECSFVGACSEVCPKHVDPASALQQVKVASTVDWYKEHLMPWVKK